VRALLKALKGNGMTAVLPDQEPDPEGGVFAPFFGVQALTMTLVHGLVSRTGCEVIMAYAKRVAGGWEIVFEEADPDIGDANVERAVAALNHSVETCIRDCPEQYHWEYKRFKKRPQGLPKLYD
jgi:KDO2-lipid IV(A) lauroyltransferase